MIQLKGLVGFVITSYSIHYTKLYENTAFITPWNENKKYQIDGFLAVDRINDLVILKSHELSRAGIPLDSKVAKQDQKSIYLTKPQGNALPLHRGVVSYNFV